MGIRVQVGVAALLLSLQPLSNGELWWQLVRGRTVLSGEWQPSSFLLSHERLPNADWLCGTIPWIVFSFCGVAGLMLLKVAVALFAGWRLQRRGGNSTLEMFFCVMLLLAAQPVLGPSSATLDFLGILLVAALVQQQRYVSIAVCAAVWANLSTGAIWVIPAFVGFAHDDNTHSVRRTARWVCTLLVCLSLTPRGPWSLVDMVVLAVPWFFNDRAFLTETGYSSSPVTMPVIGAVFLGVAAVASRGTTAFRKILIALLTVGGLLVGRQLPLAAAVSGLMLIDLPEDDRWKKTFQTKGIRVAFSAMAATIVVWNASGGLGGRQERLGWGVADHLDLRFAERDLQQHQQSRFLAHCTDVNGAGMLLMSCPSVKVLDVPEAAIRGRRLTNFWLLNHDLATGRKAAFRRQNGSEGGWWRALINEDVALLVVSQRRNAVLTSLEPTLWKPLSLDSPQLVFAVAGIPQFSAQILAARSQRDLLEYGGWRHELYSRSAAPSHTDAWAATFGALDIRADIRQARVFRAMHMNVAAVRTILPAVESRGKPLCEDEFLKTQQQFAWHEWLNCSRVSALRRQVLQRLMSDVFVPGVPTGELVLDKAALISPDVVRLYCSADLASATAALTSEAVEALYAKHVFYWESGDGRNANATLNTMETAFPDHPLTAMTRLQRDVQ
ncbi:MAG: hypothetical protein P8J37_01280 [Fuerstiella sp.]|nr:hypothetical protein [Fuerstiella sp.]